MEASGGVRIRLILTIFSQVKDLSIINMIIPNHASNSILVARLAGRPMTGDRSNLNSRVYHRINRFCSFTSTFADIQNYRFMKIGSVQIGKLVLVIEP